jgi:hypothetical protein
MRVYLVAAALSVVVLVPKTGNAQAYNLPTPVPQVTAASADWQIRGEPVFYSGNLYYPTGPTIFFDGNVMVRTGSYEGVPIYVDASVDPYGIVYVPVGGNVMRPYERLRAGELAGTVGSKMPSFPIERDVDVSVASGRTGIMTPPLSGVIEPMVIPEIDRGARAVGTGGSIVPRAAVGDQAMTVERARPEKTIMQSIPQPHANSGVWLDFNGARWYSAGPAVVYAPERFTPVGQHGGFPVYRDAAGASDRIYVAAVKGGPLAPYRR